MIKSNDYKNAFAIGVASSLIWFFVLAHLALLSEGELVALAALLPFLAIAAVAAAQTLFRSTTFNKFVKFLLVGMMNTGVDFFIFNTLLSATNIAIGLPVAAFKAISFVGAMANSYALNRSWTFNGEASARRKKTEFARFTFVTLIGFLINVGVTSAIVASIRPPFHISQIRWDNIAAVAATALNLVWNFVGYKGFVFRSKKAAPDRIAPYAP